MASHPGYIVTTNIEKFSTLFYKILTQQHEGNLICAPLSVSMVLSMLTYGARGHTERDLKSILCFADDDEINKIGYQALIDVFNAIENVQLEVANRIYVTMNMNLKPEYQQLMENYFRSVTEYIDFTDANEASRKINAWCAVKTKNHITDVISPGDIAPDTKMILVNAIYFKGTWLKKFNPLRTTPKIFHISKTITKKVQMMCATEHYHMSVLAEYGVNCIEVPYASNSPLDATTFFIVLPNEIDGLKTIESKFNDVDFFALHNQRKLAREVNLQLPKFRITKAMNLKNVLSAMGLEGIFLGSANFRGMGDIDLQVDTVIQKAFIEVNEEGSTAAAVTMTSMVFWICSKLFSDTFYCR